MPLSLKSVHNWLEGNLELLIVLLVTMIFFVTLAIASSFFRSFSSVFYTFINNTLVVASKNNLLGLLSIVRLLRLMNKSLNSSDGMNKYLRLLTFGDALRKKI